MIRTLLYRRQIIRELGAHGFDKRTTKALYSSNAYEIAKQLEAGISCERIANVIAAIAETSKYRPNRLKTLE